MTDADPTPAEPTGSRDSFGRFAPGNRCGRGNPLARRAQALRVAAMGSVSSTDLVEILRAAVIAAKAGDMVAARFVVERVLGPATAPAAPLAVDLAADDLEAVATAVAHARAVGVIDDDQAETAMRLVEARVRVREATEFERRIAAIEARQRLSQPHDEAGELRRMLHDEPEAE